MFNFILAVHVLLCLVLVALVLLQQGKGASAGALMGGSSNTLFGASGANSLITKVTTGIAIAFMITSIALVKIYGGGTVRATSVDPLSGSVMTSDIAPSDKGEGSEGSDKKADLPSDVNNESASADGAAAKGAEAVEPPPAAVPPQAVAE